jgi:hypothetical protein
MELSVDLDLTIEQASILCEAKSGEVSAAEHVREGCRTAIVAL